MRKKGHQLSHSARVCGDKVETQSYPSSEIGVGPGQRGNVGTDLNVHKEDGGPSKEDVAAKEVECSHAGMQRGIMGPSSSKGKEKIPPSGTNPLVHDSHAKECNAGAVVHTDIPASQSLKPALHKQVTDTGAVANEISTDQDNVSNGLVANRPMSEFPTLNPKDKRTSQATGQAANSGIQTTNAWKNNKPKVFMNVGVGGKLEYSKASKDRKGPLLLKHSKAIPEEKVWGYSLLGQFVGTNPGFYTTNQMRKSWGVPSKFREEGGFMFFMFDNAYDRDKVLKEGPYVAQGRTLIIKNIPDYFAFNKGSMVSIPIWARIHGLPKNYWTVEILGELASKLGVPMFMDPVTESRKRGTYARVLLELDFAEEIIRELDIAYEDGEVSVCKVLYENKRYYCPACFSFGHSMVGCTFNNREKIKHDLEPNKDEYKDKELSARPGDVDITVGTKKSDEVTTDNKGTDKADRLNQVGDDLATTVSTQLCEVNQSTTSSVEPMQALEADCNVKEMSQSNMLPVEEVEAMRVLDDKSKNACNENAKDDMQKVDRGVHVGTQEVKEHSEALGDTSKVACHVNLKDDMQGAVSGDHMGTQVLKARNSGKEKSKVDMPAHATETELCRINLNEDMQNVTTGEYECTQVEIAPEVGTSDMEKSKAAC